VGSSAAPDAACIEASPCCSEWGSSRAIITCILAEKRDVHTSISVVIPCYNHGRFLPSAIESVLAQTAVPDEIIVVDDGSTDNTSVVCAEYAGLVTCVRQENSGLSAARNRGIRHASGTFVHLLDADDLLTPSALGHVTATINAWPDASVFQGAWEEIDRDGRRLVSVDAPRLGADTFHSLFDPMVVGPPCRYTVRRSALLDSGLFDTRLRSCEDWDIWFRLALAGERFVTVSEPIGVYRNYPGSMSKNHGQMWQAGIAVLRRARERHGCQLCDEAYAMGVRKWRSYCYLTSLREDLRQHFRGKQLRRAATEMFQAVNNDPAVGRLIAMSALRRLSWRSHPTE
jgi:glycosyltransferase involved in cell wall biosynthesis